MSGNELTAAEAARVRERIAAEKRRAAARVAALEREFDNIVHASADAVRDDEHDPEGATIAFERAQVAGLLADAHTQLLALEAAADRLGGPDGGRCERCSNPIGVHRLLARPSTIRCVDCAGARSP